MAKSNCLILSRVCAVAAVCSAAILALATPALADIFQWEYINPSDPSQGKQASTTLCPSGAGVNAMPNANLSDLDLTKAYLSGADLTSAYFQFGTLPSADFSHANLTHAVFSYYADDDVWPWGAELGLADFSHANLTGADFSGSTLTNANFTGAEVRGASFAVTTRGYGFWSDSLTALQLYSTASYQNQDLSGIHIFALSLGGWNLAGQNLTNSYFFSYSGAPNFTAADTRGAQGIVFSATNLILPDGHVAGLNLTAGRSLVVRNYHGNPLASPDPGPIPIRIDQSMAMDLTGALRLNFDADDWDSRISFDPGIPVSLGGTLDLSFAAGVDVNAQIGRTFQIFDWTGVTPTGAFVVSTPYTWNLSNLYSTGEVTLTAIAGIPGDFNNDGAVNAADYITWRKGLGTTYTQAAYDVWRAHFGETAGSGAALPSAESLSATVPEPNPVYFVFAACFVAAAQVGPRSFRGRRL